MALLAGDALIPFGAQIIIDKTNIDNNIKLDIVSDYLKCAGAQGIIAGQTADIEAENKKIDFDNLKYIHKYKTGALFKCSIITGAKLAHARSDVIEKLGAYADDFGVLFQIYDDIIDCTLTTDELGKTAGKDNRENKLTYVTALGLDRAREAFYSLIEKNHGILYELNIKSNIFDDIYNSLKKKIN
ncbi:polyprenyl synthetase family protein [bacterium]|nr:polyprenyl synthetase family protein [bacterium]